MGAFKTAVTLASLASLGFAGFEFAHHLPPVLQRYRTAISKTTPAVRTVKWSPGQVSPFRIPGSSSPSEDWGSTGPSNISANSLNWAGIVQDGQHEHSVQASWKVPNFSTSPTNANSAVAEWIGLGGAQSKDLIQIGTITSPNASGHATTTVFWEELPQSAVQVARVPAGDTVNAKIEPAGTDRWRLWLKVQGLSTPLINKVITVTPSEAAGIESSADWITEAPTTNQGLAPLAPVASTTMSNIKANGVPLAEMSPKSLQPIGLYGQEGQLIAKPADSTSKDTITVNTIYGSKLPQPSSQGGGTWAIQQPGFGGGYNPWDDGGGAGGGYAFPRGYGSGSGGGWITIQPGPGYGYSGRSGGISWSITF